MVSSKACSFIRYIREEGSELTKGDFTFASNEGYVQSKVLLVLLTPSELFR
jgi:hypothetical protein